MLRSWFLLVMACSALMGGDAAAYAAHIGGATRPEHVATLVAVAGELPAAVRRQLIIRLTAMEMVDSSPYLKRCCLSPTKTKLIRFCKRT